MPNPLGGGTAIAPNCGFDTSSPPITGDGTLMWGSREAGPTTTNCKTMAAYKANMIIRCGIMWGTVNPSLDGTGFNFGNLDNILAVRSGLRFLFCMKGYPANVNGYPGAGANTTNYAKTAAAIVARYNQSGGLWGLEFYNEPDLSGWTGQQVGLIANAAANACAVSNAAKPAAQRIKLLAGTWSGGPNMTTGSNGVGAFYDTINGNANIDFVSWHPYHQATAPEVQSQAGAATGPCHTYIPAMLTYANAHNWHGNFASTEFGCSSADPGTRTRYVSETHGAKWFVRQNIMMYAHGAGRINAFCQFCFVDFDGDPAWGLVRSASAKNDNGIAPGDGTLRPLYYTYQAFLNTFADGLVSATPVITGTPTVSSVFKYRYDKTAGRYGFVFWNPLDGATISHTLTGAPANVRKTWATWNGLNVTMSQGTFATSGGSITITATNDPTYVDYVW